MKINTGQTKSWLRAVKEKIEEEHQLFKQKCREFCESTPIHGFGFLAKSQSGFETAAWILLLMLSAGFATHETRTLVEAYWTEPTTTNIAIMRNASISFTSPKHVVCMEFTFQDDLSFISLYPTAEKIRKLLRTLKNVNFTEYRIDKRSVLPQNLSVETAIALLAIVQDIVKTELYGSRSPESSKFLWSFVTGAEFIQLRPIMRDKHFVDIDLFRLSKLLGEYLCKKLNLLVKKSDRSVARESSRSDSICRTENVRWIGPKDDDLSTQVCFTVNSTLYETLRNNTEVLTVEAGPVENNKEKNRIDRPIFKHFLGLTLDLSGKSFVAEGYTESTYECYRGKNSDGKHCSAKLMIDGHFVAANLRRRPCNKDTAQSQFHCKLYCRAQLIAERCHCWPTFAKFLSKPPTSPDLPDCFTVSSYAADRLTFEKRRAAANLTADDIDEQDLSKFETGNILDCVARLRVEPHAFVLSANASMECIKDCFTDCEYMSYSFSSEKETSFRSRSVAISFYTGKVIYPRMEEQLSTTITSLLAVIGGSVGLWLGASFLAFVHMLIYCLKVSLKLLYTATKLHPWCSSTNSADKQNEESSKQQVIGQTKNYDIYSNPTQTRHLSSEKSEPPLTNYETFHNNW